MKISNKSHKINLKPSLYYCEYSFTKLHKHIKDPQGTEDKKLASQMQSGKFVKFQYTIHYNKNNACKCLAISLLPRKMHTIETFPIHFDTQGEGQIHLWRGAYMQNE
jgi:hypothetical protein